MLALALALFVDVVHSLVLLTTFPLTGGLALRKFVLVLGILAHRIRLYVDGDLTRNQGLHMLRRGVDTLDSPCDGVHATS